MVCPACKKKIVNNSNEQSLKEAPTVITKNLGFVNFLNLKYETIPKMFFRNDNVSQRLSDDVFILSLPHPANWEITAQEDSFKKIKEHIDMTASFVP